MPNETPIAEQHKFSCPDGELDEVFIENAFVHIERMDDTAFWIGIEGNGKPMLHLNTGVRRGAWYFNIEVDSLEHPEFFSVKRPRKGPPARHRKPQDFQKIAQLESELAALRARCERYEKPVSDEEIVAFLASFEEADGQDVTEWRRQALTAFLAARKGE